MSLPDPIRSRLQYGPGEGPEMYQPSRVAGLTSLHVRFLFHHHDLCLFHQSIYRGIGERHTAIDDFVAQHRSAFDEGAADEYNELARSRYRETIHTWELETAGIAAFADQLLLVGLWSMVELYSGQVLLVSERELGRFQAAAAPYRWSALKLRFADLGLGLSGCKSYSAINECRILNNKVKHSGTVDAQLAALCPFAGPIGTPLERVRFPLQRYANGVFEFVGHVMEAADEIVAARTERA